MTAIRSAAAGRQRALLISHRGSYWLRLKAAMEQVSLAEARTLAKRFDDNAGDHFWYPPLRFLRAMQGIAISLNPSGLDGSIQGLTST
ncbi:hypothetical protein GGE12_004212 [Rhizobium mongolense]|uniref:Uncharacterized protein n=1 Tax=Rhizobium mongolense TaxID=57676 RepID=A0A7W6RPS1_9HYPH|nr:hypothetical protein [Rhizobium mongolense]